MAAREFPAAGAAGDGEARVMYPDENAPDGASESANVRFRMKNENTPCGV